MPADYAPADYVDVDLTASDDFTIDGLLKLHATHGPAVRVLISPEQRAYTASQFKTRRDEINTFRIDANGATWRSILLVDAPRVTGDAAR